MHFSYKCRMHAGVKYEQIKTRVNVKPNRTTLLA